MSTPKDKRYQANAADVDAKRAAYLDQLRRDRQRPESDWRKVLMSRPEGGTRVEVKAPTQTLSSGEFRT